MKLDDLFLTEAPLPEDWDKAIFDPKTPFVQRVKYATERAKKLGSGSSRVAFEIPYQGRDTILKIAKNKKGQAQNEVEVTFLEDYLLKEKEILIPMIDYDESSSVPTWIHVEKAEKVTPTKFKKLSGFDNPYKLLSATKAMKGRGRFENDEEKERLEKLYEEGGFFENFCFLASNYDIEINDFSRLSNWGIYKGKLVVIDIGLSPDVYREHYSR